MNDIHWNENEERKKGDKSERKERTEFVTRTFKGKEVLFTSDHYNEEMGRRTTERGRC